MAYRPLLPLNMAAWGVGVVLRARACPPLLLARCLFSLVRCAAREGAEYPLAAACLRVQRVPNDGECLFAAAAFCNAGDSGGAPAGQPVTCRNCSPQNTHVGATTSTPPLASVVVAVLFVAAMAAFVVALLLFLREVLRAVDVALLNEEEARALAAQRADLARVTQQRRAVQASK